MDQCNLSTEAALPEYIEDLNITLREPLRLDLLSHLTLASHALSSLKTILFLYDDAFEEILPHDFDFRKVGFHERVVVEYTSDWLIDCTRRFSRICLLMDSFFLSLTAGHASPGAPPTGHRSLKSLY